MVTLPSMSEKGFLGWSVYPDANNGGADNYVKTIYPAGYAYELPAHNVTLYAIWVRQYGQDATFFIRTDGKILEEPSQHNDGQYVTVAKIPGAVKEGKFVSDTTGCGGPGQPEQNAHRCPDQNCVAERGDEL